MDDNTQIEIIFCGEPLLTTWGEFKAVNSDGFSEEEFYNLAQEILKNGEAHEGGGAFAEFVIRKV